MSSTAATNPKKKKKKKKNPKTYGGAKKPAKRKPASSYRAAPYRRKVANPTMKLMDLDRYVKIIPPAALGNSVGRAAVKLAGPFENGQPGWKHAFAGILGVAIGSQIVGNVFRDVRAGEYAYASGLGYVGELFLRKRFLADSAWYTENISLEGDGMNQLAGHTRTHDLGASNPCGGPGDVVQLPSGQVVQVLGDMGQGSFVTAGGQRYVQTATGWQMAGTGDITNSPTDRRLEMPTPRLPGGSMRGFQNNSQLGGYGASSNNGFGYARQAA